MIMDDKINPDQAIAYGATVLAGLLMGQLEGHKEDIVLIDVTTSPLGIESLGGKMAVLIDKNTPIPCRADKTFFTVIDGQTEADVEIF